jgi:hypothetical protein
MNYFSYFASFNPVIGAAIMVAVMLGILIMLVMYNGRKVQKLAYPAYEYELKRSQQEAARIIDEARTQARLLLEKAEAQSLEFASSHRNEGEAAEKKYQETLQAMLQDLEKRLEQSAKATEEASVHMNTALASQLEAQSKEMQARFTALYDTLAKDSAKRVDEQITKAFDVAQQETKQYEHARMTTIDSRALALVEETVKIALGKNLSKELHAELVRAALAEAKESHVF